MDVFSEELVRHKVELKDLLIILGVGFCAMIITFLCGPFFAIPNLRFIVVLVFIVVWYFAFRTVKRRYTEYEYIMTNSTFDIDKISGKRKRKNLISIDLHEIEICVSLNDDEHLSQYKPYRSINKVYDCTGYGMKNIYLIDIVTDKGLKRILFEPSENLIQNIYKFNPKKVFIQKNQEAEA